MPIPSSTPVPVTQHGKCISSYETITSYNVPSLLFDSHHILKSSEALSHPCWREVIKEEMTDLE